MSVLNEDEQNILSHLKEERDTWARVQQQLSEQVVWNRNHGHTALSRSLSVARDHADAMLEQSDKVYMHVYGILNPS